MICFEVCLRLAVYPTVTTVIEPGLSLWNHTHMSSVEILFFEVDIKEYMIIDVLMGSHKW